MTATLYEATGDHAVASIRDVFVIVWRYRTTMEGVRACRRAFERFSGAHAHAAALLTIVELGAPLPAPEVRQGIANMLASFAPLVKVSALVHEGEGFRAAAVRGVVTGLTMLATVPYPHKVFANVEDGARWMLTDAGFRSASLRSSEELAREVQRMRAEVGGKVLRATG